MNNRVVVFSGATSGLGACGAVRLAEMGARLVIIARNEARANETLAKLRKAGPSQRHTAYYADLALVSQTKRVAAEIVAAEPRIDVLINNAGAMFANRQLTAEGLERTFALNHMAYFVLTTTFRPNLAPDARIVSTASNAHSFAKLDLDDLQSTRSYAGFRAYGNSKLCNILFTRELARRLEGTRVTANCFHPGFVRTNFGAEAGSPLYPAVMKLLMALVAISPQKGAATQLYLATSPEVAGVSGHYFYKCHTTLPGAAALNDAAAARLWAESEKLATMSSQENQE